MQSGINGSNLAGISQKAFTAFNKMGIPAARHEEWKYTRIGSLFNKDYEFPFDQKISISA